MPDTPSAAPLAQVREALKKLSAQAADSVPKPSRGQSLHQMLQHCAQSVEYSLTGFPAMKPALVRATVGRLVARRFLARGAMHHNLAAPVPGAPELPAEGDLSAAWTRLYAALDRFEAHAGPLRDHFMFGSLSKEQYARLHAMHIADHLSAFGQSA